MLDFFGRAENIEKINSFSYTFIIIFICAALIKCLYDRRSSSELRPVTCSRYCYLTLLAAAAVIGLAVRLWEYGEVPGGVVYDEAMSAVDAAYEHYRCGVLLSVSP